MYRTDLIAKVLVTACVMIGCAEKEATAPAPDGGPAGQVPGEKPPASVLVPCANGEKVVLSNPGVDAGRYEMDVLVLGRNPEHLTYAIVPIYAPGAADTISGVGASLEAEDGGLLWWMSWVVNPDGSWTSEEKTLHDSLKIESRFLSNNRIRERYVLNGRERTFTFLVGSPSQEVVDEWEAFWPGGSSLDDNRYGFIAASITNSAAVERWVTAHADVGPDTPDMRAGAPTRRGWRHLICDAYRTCASLKCGLGGGPSNPLCVHCTIGVAVCFLVDVICFFFSAC